MIFLILKEEEWPLGLQRLVRNRDLNCLLSFDSLFTSAPNSSTDSSSDIDNEVSLYNQTFNMKTFYMALGICNL